MKVKSIKELVEIALSNTSNSYAEYTPGKLRSKQSKILEEVIGLQLVGAERIIDSNGIRHTLRKHGSERIESKHGQIAINLDDFNKVPLILKEPDTIFYSGKNRLKQDVFLYKKKIASVYYVARQCGFLKQVTNWYSKPWISENKMSPTVLIGDIFRGDELS